MHLVDGLSTKQCSVLPIRHTCTMLSNVTINETLGNNL